MCKFVPVLCEVLGACASSSAEIKRQRNARSKENDQIASAASIVVFWPAAFFVGGNGQTAAELAQLKGQMIAIEQASIAKKCVIQFDKSAPAGSR
jgi:hypothetical protein